MPGRGLVALLLVAAGAAGAQPPITVSPKGPIRSITDAVRRAAPGATIVVRGGVYREPTIIVDKPVTIAGSGEAVLDGEGRRAIMIVTASDVTVRGLLFRNTGSSGVEDRAAIRVADAARCVIEDNRIEEAFFAIYLAGVTNCRVTNNVLSGSGATESAAGNGIHLWSSSDVAIERNLIRGFRDGMYFEFARATRALGNTSEDNIRYGLHFMYSDDCEYRDNVFRRNGSGVAVMYTKRVSITSNRFEDHWGGAAYGLLLKEIYDPVLERNVFARNSVALLADGAVRLHAAGNEFVANGWAVKLMASSSEGRFEGNVFTGNTFDVATNSRQHDTVFLGNYWSEYRGYDLDRDGVGDVPHRPVRLFSLLVEQNEPAILLLRSLFVAVLDAAERLIPSLTPEALADHAPRMRRAA